MPRGQALLCAPVLAPVPICVSGMDRAYEGDETHRLAEELSFTPVVPLNPTWMNLMVATSS